jgi:hypothetical protein
VRVRCPPRLILHPSLLPASTICTVRDSIVVRFHLRRSNVEQCAMVDKWKKLFALGEKIVRSKSSVQIPPSIAIETCRTNKVDCTKVLQQAWSLRDAYRHISGPISLNTTGSRHESPPCRISPVRTTPPHCLIDSFLRPYSNSFVSESCTNAWRTHICGSPAQTRKVLMAVDSCPRTSCGQVERGAPISSDMNKRCNPLS